MQIATLSPASLDKELLIPAVSGKRIRLQRILAATTVVRWITITSAASDLVAGTSLISDLLLSNLSTFDVVLEKTYAVTTVVSEGVYIQLSSDAGKTDLTAWYDVVP